MDRKVIVYSTSGCSYCVRAKQFLQENNIIFENFDISSDQQKTQEMIQKSGQMGVPVLDIDGEIIVGFDKEKIKKVLGL